MKTSVFESPFNIVIHDTDIPETGDEEILVKLEGTGVCASNLPVWEGREWFKYPFEAGAPGHEGYGKVAATGRRVKDLSPGDRVSLISYHAYAEYDKAHFSNVVRMPDTADGIAFPGEPAACAVNVFKRSGIKAGDKVLIIGAGYLGCLLVQLVKSTGAEVTVVSRRNTSLRFAEAAGADNLEELKDYYSTLGSLKKLFPDGIGIIIEATGMQSSIDLATEIIGIRGRLVIAGYHQDGLRNVNMQVWNWKGIDVINAHERDQAVYIEGLKEAIEFRRKKILQPEKFITHFVTLNNINDAFRMLKERPENFLKAVVTY
ncbi:MAG TPA: zinc-binding dehydrogenase [Bacteroidales bacterium]|nr:zinc-binding dehydrogenase [Bacteroidales bacterium]